LKGHKDWVLHIGYSPDGKRLVTGSGSEDKTARVWDASNGRELQVLHGHTDYIGSVAFSPDGRRVVTGSGNADRPARIWNVGAQSKQDAVWLLPQVVTCLSSSVDRPAVQKSD
jgi:WD40 repeat protein